MAGALLYILLKREPSQCMPGTREGKKNHIVKRLPANPTITYANTWIPWELETTPVIRGKTAAKLFISQPVVS